VGSTAELQKMLKGKKDAWRTNHANNRLSIAVDWNTY
jgi:hypothetical protein